MDTPTLVVLIVLVVLAVLIGGGYLAGLRRQREREVALRQRIAAANEALADARAEDRGWDRDVLDEAVRAAVAGPVDEVHLVHVEDRPGTDDDLAVYRVVQGAQEREITLRRAGGDWYAE